GPAWFQPVPNATDTWLEVKGSEGAAAEIAEVIGAVMQAEEETGQVAAELSGRYEEIDLIYTISEILGHTIRLDEAANRILREVSAVVRARRATLLVHDPRAHVLRLVAARGVDLGEIEPIEVDDRSEEHTSELQSQSNLVCRLLLEKKKDTTRQIYSRQHQKQ